MTVVREDRDRLALLLSDYMDEKIKSFDLDKGLCDLSESKDSAVRELAEQMWYQYDDIANHTIVADRVSWNAMQRWLLFLKTDEPKSSPEIPAAPAGRWRAAARLAIILAGVILSAWALSFAMRSYAGICFWLTGAILAIWQHTPASNDDSGLDPAERERERCAPFSARADILCARRSCAAFRKKPYPPKLRGKTIRPAWMYFIMSLPSYLLLWPLVALGWIRTAIIRKWRPQAGGGQI